MESRERIYGDLLARAPGSDRHARIAFLDAELPQVWINEYKAMTSHDTNIVKVTFDTFTYLYDLSTEILGDSCAADIENRLVVAFGISCAPEITRESSRIRGWIGPTERVLGRNRDKGHFIAHTIGGRVDGFEINLFSQIRHINRNWSVRGKLYRSMELFCAKHPGTFCWSKPSYSDNTSTPVNIEFGVLLPDGTLWVEEFEN